MPKAFRLYVSVTNCDGVLPYRHDAASSMGHGDDDRAGDGRTVHRRTRNLKGGERFGLSSDYANRTGSDCTSAPRAAASIEMALTGRGD